MIEVVTSHFEVLPTRKVLNENTTHFEGRSNYGYTHFEGIFWYLINLRFIFWNIHVIELTNETEVAHMYKLIVGLAKTYHTEGFLERHNPPRGSAHPYTPYHGLPYIGIYSASLIHLFSCLKMCGILSQSALKKSLQQNTCDLRKLSSLWTDFV